MQKYSTLDKIRVCWRLPLMISLLIFASPTSCGLAAGSWVLDVTFLGVFCRVFFGIFAVSTFLLSALLFGYEFDEGRGQIFRDLRSEDHEAWERFIKEQNKHEVSEKND